MTAFPIPAARPPSLPARVVPAAGAIAASVVLATLVDSPWLLRLALACCLAALVVGIGIRSPRLVLLGLLLWLCSLGFVRRLLSGVSPLGGPDPLLLVGPFALAALALAAHAAGAFRSLTVLSKTVGALTLLVAASAFNPLQGSLLSGLSGLLFFAPLLAFWIGRGLCDDRTLRRAIGLVAAIAIPVAIYGLAQVFLGFPSWDGRWIQATAPGSFQGAVRPFASFSASSEFGTFLGIGAICWLAVARRVPLTLTAGALSILGVALLYQGSRGIIVMVVAAAGLMLGARRRLPLAASMAFGAALLFLLPVVVEQVAPSTFSGDASGRLLARQVTGLANPLDPEASTVGIHVSLVAGGIAHAFREPLGLGVGAVTIAGEKFGGRSYGTEADPSNAAVATGIPGLTAYLLLLVLALPLVYRQAARRPSGLTLAALGLVTVTTFQWLNGGQYAVALLPWLVLGWADRRSAEEDA